MFFSKKLPGRWRETIMKQSDLVNAPHIGVDDNGMHANVQMNIASAKKPDGCYFIFDVTYTNLTCGIR